MDGMLGYGQLSAGWRGMKEAVIIKSNTYCGHEEETTTKERNSDKIPRLRPLKALKMATDSHDSMLDAKPTSKQCPQSLQCPETIICVSTVVTRKQHTSEILLGLLNLHHALFE